MPPDRWPRRGRAESRHPVRHAHVHHASAGVNTEGLVKLVTTRVGPHEETSEWSYPDFIDLSAAPTRMTLTGFARAQHKVTLPDSKAEITVDTMFVASNYFRTIGIALARRECAHGRGADRLGGGSGFYDAFVEVALAAAT